MAGHEHSYSKHGLNFGKNNMFAVVEHWIYIGFEKYIESHWDSNILLFCVKISYFYIIFLEYLADHLSTKFCYLNMDFIKILLNIKIVIRKNIFPGVSEIDATTRRKTNQKKITKAR